MNPRCLSFSWFLAVLWGLVNGHLSEPVFAAEKSTRAIPRNHTLTNLSYRDAASPGYTDYMAERCHLDLYGYGHSMTEPTFPILIRHVKEITKNHQLPP